MNTNNIDIPTTIGGRIKKLRIDQKFTQAVLAELLSVNDSVISNIERDKRLPTFLQLLALCEELESSADYIIFGSSRKDDGVMPDTVKTAILQLADEIRACHASN